MKMEVIAALNNNTTEQDLNDFQSAGLKVTRLLKGAYKGKEESQYRLTLSDLNELRKFEGLLKEHDQEAYLFFQDDNTANLVNLNTNDITTVGVWTNVDKETALHQDNYVFDVIDNKFYICIK